MSDETNAPEMETEVEASAEAEGPKTYTQEEFDSELQGLKANQQKALDEAKKAKAELATLRKQQQEAQRKAMEEKEDFKGLYESRNAELEDLRKRNEELEETLRSGAVDGNATKIGAAIGVDEASQELLAEQAKKYIAFEDGKAVYKIGGVEVSKEEVVKTLREKYPRLVNAALPSGSGARPSTNNGGAVSNSKAKAEAIAKAKKSGDPKQLRAAHNLPD